MAVADYITKEDLEKTLEPLYEEMRAGFRRLESVLQKYSEDMKEHNRGQMESLGRIENLGRNPNY